MRPGLQSRGRTQYFQYRPAVDGLRGVAVLAVLGFHAFPDAIPGGYVGVDVFFVISGFLITSIILRRLLDGRFSFADFYWRRVRRLFPALVLVLAATFALGWFILLPDEFEQLGKHIAAAAVFLANAAFWRESGYFDTAAEFKPLLHLWSLGIEEQFYLVWPVILALLWKRRRLLLVVLSILIVASFALSVTLSHWAPVANFYSPASRFWELGVGCLLAVLKEYPRESQARVNPQERNPHRQRFAILPFVGIACILVAIAAINDSTPFPGWATLLPVVGALLVLAGPEHAWLQRHVLGSRPLVWVGLISYALYLWHWPLLAFANILEAGPLPSGIRGAALMLSFLLAWLTYRFVEVSVRSRDGLRLNVGLVAAAGVAGIAGIIVYAAGGIDRRFDVDVKALRHEHRLDDVCRARINEDTRINYCRTTSTQPPTVIFVGDSRAQAVYEGAAPLLAAENSVMLLGRGGCPPLLNVRIRGYDLNEEDCEGVWRTFVRYVHEAKPEVVVIVGNGSFLIRNPEIRLFRDGVATPESKEAVFEYGIRSLMSELRKSSQVIHLGEIPAFATTPSCFLRSVRLPTTRCVPELDRQEVERSMREYVEVLQKVQTALPDVQFIDAIEALCSANTCSQHPAGKPILYSDAIHLSPAGGRLLIESTGLPKLIRDGIRG